MRRFPWTVFERVDKRCKSCGRKSFKTNLMQRQSMSNQLTSFWHFWKTSFGFWLSGRRSLQSMRKMRRSFQVAQWASNYRDERNTQSNGGLCYALPHFQESQLDDAVNGKRWKATVSGLLQGEWDKAGFMSTSWHWAFNWHPTSLNT